MKDTIHAADPADQANAHETVRVSVGSAAVIGLSDIRLAAAPTTAYLMSGEGCVYDCAFCTQARTARAGRGALSRVNWPEHPMSEVTGALRAAAADGRIERVCLQVVHDHDWRREVTAVLRAVTGCNLPVSASVHLADPADVLILAELGVDRVSLPLDAATPALYREIKGRPCGPAWRALQRAAELLPRRVGTHLIVGLGETEAELVGRLADLAHLAIDVSLFAFTPVRGTRLADRPAPPHAVYRRAQVAHFLLRHGLVRFAQMRFSADGTLVDFGLPPARLRAILCGLADDAPREPGTAFRTTGCSGCNRPYFNERVGSEPHNFPRPLTQRELARCLTTLGLDVTP